MPQQEGERVFGLSRDKVYQVPPGVVSYHPSLAGDRGLWTGRVRHEPCGPMAEFQLERSGLYWLRPWTVSEYHWPPGVWSHGRVSALNMAALAVPPVGLER